MAALVLLIIALAFLPLTGCGGGGGGDRKQLSLAVNSGVEGDALKQAARDYEAQTGIRVQIAEFDYANLFAKELVDLKNATGAYDLIMLDDPWFPRFATEGLLTDLAPLYQTRNQTGPDADFVPASIALCKHPYESGALTLCPTSATRSCSFTAKTFSTNTA